MTAPTTDPTGAELLDAIASARDAIDQCREEKTAEYVRLLDLVADDPELSYSTVAEALGVTRDSLFKARRRPR